MARQRKLEARAVRRVLERETRALVGWLYQWNTGQLAYRWIGDPVEDVVFD